MRGRPKTRRRTGGGRGRTAWLAALGLALGAALSGPGRISADEPRQRACEIERCQALGPAAPYPIAGVDCAAGDCGELNWRAARPLDWQRYAQGEYVGHARLGHVPEYRLRVGDELDFVFSISRIASPRPYRFEVGDELRVESFSDPEINHDLLIQPDGTVTLRLLNQVYAARTTVSQLRDELERRYAKYYKQPSITVTPLKVNTRIEDMRSTVDLRYGYGGQSRRAKVTPEGTVQLPLIGSIPVLGLTLNELEVELEERFAAQSAALEVTPVLLARAPRYVYVLGEVALPGRYELTGPTTAMQAISAAGGWNHGGNVWKTVIFRRGDDWRLMATQLDLRGPLYGKRPCPADEIWLNDSDIVLVPKTRILVAQNAIDLVFTQGVFKVVPFSLRAGYFQYRISEINPSAPVSPVLPVIAPPPAVPVHLPPGVPQQ